AQRRVLHGWGPRPNLHQPQWRDPGRHLERRDDLLPRCFQADRDGYARAANGGRAPPEHDDQGTRPPRPVRAAARGPDRRGDGRPRPGGPRTPARGRASRLTDSAVPRGAGGSTAQTVERLAATAPVETPRRLRA